MEYSGGECYFEIMCCAVKLLILIFGVSACQADNELRLYTGSLNKYITTSLTNATAILPHLNKSKPTCFYVHGIATDPTSISVTTVISTLIKTNKYNVVLLDWSKVAKNVLGIVPLSYALINTPGAEAVGKTFGEALCDLIKKGLSITNFFLMGHSMGAQVVGVAGRRAKELGFTIPKIVGLDPAGPEFTTVVPLYPTLDTTCAAIVILIHTDPNGLGTSNATGHIDFFPNYNKTYTMQPGCTEKANMLVLNDNTTCSHDYSWRLLCVSLENACVLEGAHATDGDAWLAGQGDPDNTAVISVDPTPGASGSYFLRTVAAYPYCIGEDGIYPQ